MGVFDSYDDDRLESADDELPTGEVTRHGKHGFGKIAKRDQPQPERSWHWWARRASSLGDPLDNLYQVHRWEKRLLALAYARHPDLLALVGSVPDILAPCPPDRDEDAWTKHLAQFKREIEKVNDTALDRVGANTRSNLGSALHQYDQRRLAGEDLAFVPPLMRAGLDRLADIRAGLTVHAAEQFVVFEDVDPPAGRPRIPSCGTYDNLVSPKPGMIMFAPDGTVITSADRMVDDTKSGNHDPRKPSYLCQPVPYVRGTPYDFTLTAQRRADGDNGLRDWPDGVRPHQRWALIAHVPLDSLDDAGLLWVDVEQGEHWARAAQTLRELTSEAQRTAKKAFHAAHPPVPDPDTELVESPEPLELPTPAVAAEPVALATVTAIPLDRKIALCGSVSDLDALYAANAAAWTEQLAGLARHRWRELQEAHS